MDDTTNHPTLVYNLRSLARFEHADLSIGDEAADMIERQAADIAAKDAEVARLRQIVSECGAAIGNGTVCAPAARLDFMACIPAEIAAVRDIRVAKIAELRAEIERLRAGGCARDQTTTQYCAEAVGLAAEVERFRGELSAATGYMLNAKMDLETGAPKRTAITTIEGGLRRARDAVLPSPPADV